MNPDSHTHLRRWPWLAVLFLCDTALAAMTPRVNHGSPTAFVVAGISLLVIVTSSAWQGFRRGQGLRVPPAVVDTVAGCLVVLAGLVAVELAQPAATTPDGAIAVGLLALSPLVSFVLVAVMVVGFVAGTLVE